ncbi:heat shock 70 kDa protein 12B-like [Mytilus edulis]|uniref:heat shock 70 kDa protein 12B-like n=1 Tax=Mytilus edulis TaxID=6550 RepID=UPI0039EF1B66
MVRFPFYIAVSVYKDMNGAKRYCFDEYNATVAEPKTETENSFIDTLKRLDYINEPPNISTNICHESKLLSFKKAPTAVLLDSSQEFVAFGFEAENMYSVLVADERHEGYYFFHRFKMLINNRRITTKTMIKDEAGKEMEASRVFHLTIQYLKDHLNTKIIETVKEEHRQQICVFYVLTVPAKWDYSAVELMREAAIEAGIDSRQLAIVSEPEAASMFCQVVNSPLHDTQQKNSFETQFKSGKMFMMVDLGGMKI